MTKDEEKDEPVVWGASVLSKPEYIAEQKAKTKELRNMMDESVQTVPNFDQLQQIVNNLERCLTRDSKHEFLRVWIRDWTEHKLSKRTSAALEAKDEPPRFPTMLRKMWSGREVQDWINENWVTPLQQEAKDEPVAWISVKDELPKAVRGVSYKSSLTDTVLILHSDRPDYPITAHAVVGEGLGAGVAIPTDGASEHPEIAWYSASCNLKNPFNLRNDDYERFLPKIFGTKITHWMPIPTTPPQRKPLTDEEAHQTLLDMAKHIETFGDESTTEQQLSAECIRFILNRLAAHGIKE